jgi:hypothetical protein
MYLLSRNLGTFKFRMRFLKSLNADMVLFCSINVRILRLLTNGGFWYPIVDYKLEWTVSGTENISRPNGGTA